MGIVYRIGIESQKGTRYLDHQSIGVLLEKCEVSKKCLQEFFDEKDKGVRIEDVIVSGRIAFEKLYKGNEFISKQDAKNIRDLQNAYLTFVVKKDSCHAKVSRICY